MQKITPLGHWTEKTISNSQKVPRANFLWSDGLFCFSSICKFYSIKNTFAMITSLSEIYFRFRRLILLVQTKKVTFINLGSSTSSWKPWKWVRFDLWWMLKPPKTNVLADQLIERTSSMLIKTSIVHKEKGDQLRKK